jgi:hypothetical protein
MPFDGRGFDVGAPSLRTLADVLRDRSRWPADMPEWDYAEPSCCGIGIARFLWGRRDQSISQLFSIPYSAAIAIFCYAHTPLRIYCSAVTPEHVADAIDAYLASVPERQSAA